MICRFDGYELDLETAELTRDGEVLPLPPQPANLLVLLVRNAGRTVSREEIQRHVWKGAHVEADVGINSCIRKIRAQLADDSQQPRFIQTIPRRGYRFVAPVTPSEDSRPGRGRGAGLRWVALSGGLLFGVVLLALSVAPLRSPPSASADVAPDEQTVVVAVLPFVNLSADPAHAFVSDGLTEEVITRLGRIDPSRLAIIARTTSMQLAGTQESLPEIAERLRARYLVEGSVQRENGRLRVTVRLVDGETGVQLGADSYETSMHDLLRAQVAVAESVTAWLSVELHPLRLDATEIADFGDITPELYERYLEGLHRLHAGSAEGYLESRELFTEVTRAAADFAPAWAGLAEANLWLGWFGGDPQEVMPRFREAAERAIALDGALGSPHLLIAYAALYLEHDLAEARARFERAIALEPGSARAQAWYAAYLSAVGRHAEAVRRARIARRLDPLAMAVRADLCWLLNYARRFDEAATTCSHALELQPRHFWTGLGMVEALRQRARNQEAVAVFSDLIADPDITESWSVMAETDGEAALDQIWQWLDRRLEAGRDAGRRQPYAAASVAALLGRPDEALTWLEEARAERDALVLFAGVDPRFDGLRERNEYRALLADLGLAELGVTANL